MPNDGLVDSNLERDGREGAESAETKVRVESLDGREDLVKRAREEGDGKSGRTGITGEFGALTLVDSKQDFSTSSIERNSAGQVTGVEYPDGHSERFQYGTDGRVNRITDQNGWSWRREADGWNLYNSDGQRTTERLQGDIEVDRSGNYIFTSTDGTREIQRPDGSYRREYANGGSFERNADGQVTRVVQPDGSFKTFTYGADGRVSTVTDQSGWSWRRDGDAWHLYNDNGDRTGEPLQGDIDVDQHGNFIFRNQDGTRETSGPNGTYIRHNPDGQVTRVTQPDGSRHDFEYGADGRVSRVSDTSGWSWRRQSDGWRLYDDRGRRTGEPLRGDIEVDRDGNYIFVQEDGTQEITRPDGTVRRVPAPRSATTR